jgi:hypothetical protein
MHLKAELDNEHAFIIKLDKANFDRQCYETPDSVHTTLRIARDRGCHGD